MIRSLMIFLAASVVLACVAAGVILLTEPGLKLTAKAVSSATGNMVTIDRAEGRLLGRWRLAGVKVETESAVVSVQALTCDWVPARLLEKQLQLLDVSVEGVEVVVSDTGGEKQNESREPAVLPEIAVPAAIMIGSLSVDGAVVRKSGVEKELFVLDSLSLAMALNGDRIALKSLRLAAPGYGISLQGELRLSGDWPLTVKGDYWVRREQLAEIRGELALTGSVAAPEADLRVLEPAPLVLQGQVKDVLNSPSWQLTASTENFDPSSVNNDWPELNLGLRLSSEGSLERYRADIEASVNGRNFGQTGIKLSLTGSSEHVLIENGQISAAGGTAAVSGKAEWDDAVRWQASIAVDGLDPSIVAGAPAADINAQITAAGTVAPEQVRYRLKIEELDGTFTDPALRVKGMLKLDGTEKGLSLHAAEFDTGGGRLFVSGECSWEQALSWDALVRAESVDPSAFAELPDGEINGVVSSSGRLLGDELAFVAKVASLSGQLSGYDVGGGGVVEYRDSAWHISNFHLTNGRNQLMVQGQANETLDLSFTLEAVQLDALLPALKGGLSAGGTLSGSRKTPRLAASVRSDGISYDGYGADSISADIDFDLEKDGRVEVAAAVNGADINGHVADRIDVTLGGSTGRHDGFIRIDSEFGDLSVNLAGGLDGSRRWCGSLSGTSIRHPDYGEWLQKGSARLEASAESLKLDRFCLYSDETGLCASAEADVSGTWSARAEELAFSLAKLNEWGIVTPGISGAVQGTIGAAGKGTVFSALDVEIGVAELELDADAGEVYSELRWFDTRLAATLAGEHLKLGISSRFVDDSTINGELEVDGFADLAGPFTELPISGSLNLEVRDLSPLAVVTGSYLIPSGRLSSSLSLSGRVGTPAVDGTLRLAEGALTLPELGVMLEDLEGELSSSGNQIMVGLKAVSGEGMIAADGSISFAEKPWKGEFRIKGDNTELLNQSELGIVASPDLLLKVGADGGSLAGSVMIDRGRIEPEEMSGSEAESKDVILMDEQAEGGAWPFIIDVAVDLGDELHIDGYGLRGTLKGGLKISMTEPGRLLGKGEVYLADSVISVFGRRLDISRGRVVFDGGPVDSPGLDVSATKVIKGESLGENDVVVGINVDGVIYDYNVELFSIPPMDEARILAYLLLDKSSATDEGESTLISAAAGSIGLGGEDGLLGKVGGLLPLDEMRITGSGLTDDSSLVLGKKLTEKLSVRYDYSLFKNIGFFKIRYNFGHGVAAETKSSTEVNGVDLLYSFER